MNKLHDCGILNCFCVDPDALLNCARDYLVQLFPFVSYRHQDHDSFIQRSDYLILVGFSSCECEIQASDGGILDQQYPSLTQPDWIPN